MKFGTNKVNKMEDKRMKVSIVTIIITIATIL